jgi:hypothetical protein
MPRRYGAGSTTPSRWRDGKTERRRFVGNNAVDTGALAALGLRWPCTVAEVKAAYRERVKVAHPDCGGSAEAFISLTERYKLAQLVVERRTAGRPAG